MTATAPAKFATLLGSEAAILASVGITADVLGAADTADPILRGLFSLARTIDSAQDSISDYRASIKRSLRDDEHSIERNLRINQHLTRYAEQYAEAVDRRESTFRSLGVMARAWLKTQGVDA